MKGLTFFAVLALTLSVLSAALPVNGEMEIYDSVIRLHVIANSNSATDQENKLRVRDSLLEAMADITNDGDDYNAALSALNESIPLLEETAENALDALGSHHGCSISIGYEKYPAREYEGVSLPAGKYMSVKAVIGEGEGENWWCVMFPPLCLGASKAEEKLISAGLTRDEVDILTDSEDGSYVLKFRFLEFFKQTFGKK